MGELLANARQVGARVFVLGEPPLDVLAALIAEEYLTQLPVIAVDLNSPQPPSVDPDEESTPLQGRAAAAKQVGRHLHKGDVLVAFMHDGKDKETRMVLEAARARRLSILVVGGLDSKDAVRRLATVRLTLPTRGIKTVCESVFVCARIMARVSRAALQDVGEADARLVQVVCDTCNERVFLDEELRGAKATCPLCQAGLAVPGDSSRRAPAASSRIGAILPGKAGETGSASEEEEEEVAEPEVAKGWGAAVRTREARPKEKERRKERKSERRRDEDPSQKKTRRRMKPSVMEFKAPALEEDGELEAPTTAAGHPASGASSRTPAEATPDPVGLLSNSQPQEPRPEPSFGSGITVGSDLVPIGAPEKTSGRGAATTQSADPYALEDAYLQDIELPSAQSSASGSDPSVDGEGSRRLSSRYTIAECRLRWGRGGYPDEASPVHELVALSSSRLVFYLDPDDEAGATLQKGDELWIRVDIPAFIEPILVRGALKDISGTSGGGRGARATLEFTDLDPTQRRKLARAAENIFGAPA